MPISLALRGRHTRDSTAIAAWAAVMDSLGDIDRTFSTYRPDSVISRLGRGELARSACPPEVRGVLELGEQAERESGGAFCIQQPGPDGTVVLDTDGVVKGWACDRAAKALYDLPDTDFSLSAGGDLLCRTFDPETRPWRIGIEDPREPSRIIAVIPVRSGAVATSGTAHRGQHLIDARTGLAPTTVASVTVKADSLTWADLDATAAYAHDHDAARWLATRPGRTGLVVWQDGTTALVDPGVSSPPTPCPPIVR